jgi:hypothetical protein
MMSLGEAFPFLILLAAHAAIVLPIERGGDLSPYRMSLGAHVVKNAAFSLWGGFIPLRYFELQDLWQAAGQSEGSVLWSFASAVLRRPLLAAGILAGAAAIAMIALRGGRSARYSLAWILLAAAPYLFLEGSGERFLYVPSFGACAILGLASAALWQRRRTWPGRSAGAAAAITLLLGLHVLGNLDRQDDWSTSGKWTRGIVARWSYLEGLDPETSIEFVGIPDRWGSAWVFRNGFSSMVRTHWQGRPYWREEERPEGTEADERMGVMLNPLGNVGMLPAELMPEGTGPGSP